MCLIHKSGLITWIGEQNNQLFGHLRCFIDNLSRNDSKFLRTVTRLYLFRMNFNSAGRYSYVNKGEKSFIFLVANTLRSPEIPLKEGGL